MRASATSSRFLLVWVAVAPFAWAQTGSGQNGGADHSATATAAEPLRIEIVGASVSAGFVDGPLTGGSPDNRTTPLLRVVRGWAGEGATVTSRADLLMFQGADERGKSQVLRATRQQPDLALAIDFLFWFGYGYVDAPDGDEGKARREHLGVGLDQLAEFHCPLVIGDLPDVHGAAARMIHLRQIPSVEVLDELNRVIAAWAAERPNVRVFPLRALVAEMKQKGVTLPLAAGPLATAPGALMQGDRLHATRVGMGYLGFLLQSQIAAALPAGGRTLPHLSLDEFLVAADATVDLDDLRAHAGGKGAPGEGQGGQNKGGLGTGGKDR